MCVMYIIMHTVKLELIGQVQEQRLATAQYLFMHDTHAHAFMTVQVTCVWCSRVRNYKIIYAAVGNMHSYSYVIQWNLSEIRTPL